MGPEYYHGIYEPTFMTELARHNWLNKYLDIVDQDFGKTSQAARRLAGISLIQVENVAGGKPLNYDLSKRRLAKAGIDVNAAQNVTLEPAEEHIANTYRKLMDNYATEHPERFKTRTEYHIIKNSKNKTRTRTVLVLCQNKKE